MHLQPRHHKGGHCPKAGTTPCAVADGTEDPGMQRYRAGSAPCAQEYPWI